MADSKEFSDDLLKALENKNLEKLYELYVKLSEEENLSKAKGICMILYQERFLDILDIIKQKSKIDPMFKYYSWHIFQLMTSCSEVKDEAQKDFSLLPALMDLLLTEWESPKEQDSMQIISLNYLIIMLGGAEDTYYDHVVSCGAMTFIYNVLGQSSLNSTDPIIESVILLLNLLLEGTDACKKQLIDMEFSKLLSKKLRDRCNCGENLFKIASMTHQKLLLLTSDSQEFVETFRKEFDNEAKKQPVYQNPSCFNVNCDGENKNFTAYKRCARCKTALYCSKDCQVKHWKSGHSKDCKNPP